MTRVSALTRFFLLGVMLLCVGCGGGEPTDINGSQNAGAEEYLLQIDGDTASYSSQQLFKSDNPTATAATKDVTKIVFTFPRFEVTMQPALRDSINQAIEQLLLLNEAGDLAYDSIEQRMSDFITQYKEDAEMAAGMGWGVDAKWLCDVEIQVLANTPRLVSLRFSELNFTGGAHGNTQTSYLNFDAKTGKRLSLADLISVEPEKLRKIAEKYFRRKAEIPDNKPITETSFEFLSGEFELPDNLDNVGITRKSLIIRQFKFPA